MIFNLFSRKKILNWEFDMIKRVIQKLPKEFHYLLDYFNESYYIGVTEFNKGFQVHFTIKYNDIPINPYEEGYDISDIKIFDRKKIAFVNFSFFVSSGILFGYQSDTKKPDLDLDQIIIDNFKKIIDNNADLEKIKLLLKQNEYELVHKSSAMEIILNGLTYYTIASIEGTGNYWGIDSEGIVYELRHDPLEVEKVYNNVVDWHKDNFPSYYQ